MRKLLSFQDVLITPQFSEIRSRKDVDISSTFMGVNYNVPIISSNMDSVTTVDMAKAMKKEGAAACLHRFWSIQDNVNALKQSGNTMVSFGLGANELERFEALWDNGARNFILDVAHGASINVVEQVQAARALRGDDFNLVVGNFATGRSIKDFLYHLTKEYSVDAYKVGIGGGSACTTRIVTGCGWPTFASIQDCVTAGVPVIADGGIKTSGDFAKAMAAGASMVMLGGLLAGCDESPGLLTTSYYDEVEILKDNPDRVKVKSSIQDFETCKSNIELFKVYRGSASKESYEVQGKVSEWRTPEGESFLVPYSGPVKNVIQELSAGLRSAMSYVGASNLNEFKENCEFINVTESGAKESSAHGKRE